jgi:hypothetical protein
MILRKRIKTNYHEATETIDSTSYWKKQTSSLLKIEPVDCTLQTMFGDAVLKAENLLLPQWETGEWLINVNIDTLNVSNKIKTLIAKIKYVYIAQSTMREMYVDGFMDTLLHILEFDDYPCLMYPQYEYFADIGEDEEHHIIAKSDFGILTQNHRMVIVIEDKTMENAKYSNNWKEDQVLGELFVAVHDTVRNHKDVSYPINIYAIRVVGTLFTFYKTSVDKEYVKETLRGYPKNNSMIIQRHPPVADEPNLTAYDICDNNDRRQILRCMSSIKEFLI